MKPLLQLVPQGNEHGSCHYCKRAKLKENGKGLDYPYSNLVRVEGTNVVTNFCPDCFEEVIRFVKGLPQAIDSTAHAQADTDPLPFEPSKDELED